MDKVFLIDYDLCSSSSCGRPCISQCPITLTNIRKKPHERKDEVPIRYKKYISSMEENYDLLVASIIEKGATVRIILLIFSPE